MTEREPPEEAGETLEALAEVLVSEGLAEMRLAARDLRLVSPYSPRLIHCLERAERLDAVIHRIEAILSDAEVSSLHNTSRLGQRVMGGRAVENRSDIQL